jgi:hypothetical protein
MGRETRRSRSPQYCGGSEDNYVDLQLLNPPYRIAVDPKFVGRR